MAIRLKSCRTLRPDDRGISMRDNLMGGLLAFSVMQGNKTLLEAWLVAEAVLLLLSPLVLWLMAGEGLIFMISYMIYWVCK